MLPLEIGATQDHHGHLSAPRKLGPLAPTQRAALAVHAGGMVSAANENEQYALERRSLG